MEKVKWQVNRDSAEDKLRDFLEWMYALKKDTLHHVRDGFVPRSDHVLHLPAEKASWPLGNKTAGDVPVCSFAVVLIIYSMCDPLPSLYSTKRYYILLFFTFLLNILVLVSFSVPESAQNNTAKSVTAHFV